MLTGRLFIGFVSYPGWRLGRLIGVLLILLLIGNPFHRSDASDLDQATNEQSDAEACFSLLEALAAADSTSLVDLESYPIAFHGSVMDSLIRYHPIRRFNPVTYLTISIFDYLTGYGPDTVRIRLDAVQTTRLGTWVSREGPSGSSGQWFAVPKPGDSAIFWISRLDSVAAIRIPEMIWPTEGENVPHLGRSISEVRALIENAASCAAASNQIRFAISVIRGRLVGGDKACEKRNGRAYSCHDVVVEEQIRGAPVDSQITIVTPQKYWSHVQKRGSDRGLLLLGSKTLEGKYELTNPAFGFLPQVGDEFVIGYEIHRGADVDVVAPVHRPEAEILR